MVRAILFAALAAFSVSAAWAQGPRHSPDLPPFGDYAAERVIEPHPVEPRLSRTSKLWQFRTAIREAAADPYQTFGGHYIFASWGCGTQCQNGAIIDMLTSSVFEIPPAAAEWAFEPESNLLVVNPGPMPAEDIPEWMKRKFFVWNEQTKKFDLIWEGSPLIGPYSDEY